VVDDESLALHPFGAKASNRISAIGPSLYYRLVYQPTADLVHMNARAVGRLFSPGDRGAECVRAEDFSERVVNRVRLDPLDARKAATRGSASSAPKANAAVPRVILRVKDGAGGGYR
jgi:hypothetical protein